MQHCRQQFLAKAVDRDSGRSTVQRDLVLEVLRDHGRVRIRAFGTSMLPTLWPGDVLSIERTDLGRIGGGDIVLFMRCGRLFAHRVLAVGGGTDRILITQGDSVHRMDPPCAASELLGRVIGVLRGGSEIQLERSCFSRIASWLFCRTGWLGGAPLTLHTWWRRMAARERTDSGEPRSAAQRVRACE